ncbi:MAG: methyltransferase domain-containing protein [Cyanomargarita calcarea GSE-NOS-MK-12-04C]|jgi:SAM-dependent methyltransferase|uniref:Methyltransferase domain-containing protein n=1 Tax=Cyanomargarita calcarea GSE-NOS-MK-12-04C TaxID=2839659 RepID=A0A951US44_9CYAN|nr:methyltransferase domain-containing protein [Cyanomargarita calcarea GSE-NOS-MK-12-04C]
MTNSEYWEQRYQDGTDVWDLGQAVPPFISLLESTALPPGRLAVLGCGRGYDALLFAEYGFDVIGFDFANSVITEANALAEATESSAKFLTRDIFDLPNEFEGYFDYLVEHTCFCAIYPAQRPAYVQMAKSILKPQGEIIGLFFTHNRPGGPPFGVTTTEIREYFSNDFEIRSLEPAINSIPKRQGEEHMGRFRVIKK